MLKAKQILKLAVILFMCFILLGLLLSSVFVLGTPNKLDITDEYCVNTDPVMKYEKDYCEELMSYKLGKNVRCTLIKELFDFTDEANYILCYDENNNWYAIINRVSGDVIERRESVTPYEDYLKYDCYYLGFGNYFYKDSDIIKSITDKNIEFNVHNVPDTIINESSELQRKALQEGVFKSRDEIQKFVKDSENAKISLCSASNRDNAVYCGDTWYWINLINAYMSFQIFGGYGFDSERMGVYTFTDYEGNEYDDLLFPINFGVTCGIVSATMLLQYYERNGIVNTIPSSIYDDCYRTINNAFLMSKIDKTVAQRVHNEINALHNPVGGGSTYVSVKDAINAFCDSYGNYNLGATSNVTDVGVKSSINAGDPVILFTNSVATGDSAYLNSNDYYNVEIDNHSVIAYGYTKNWLGAVDEYICNIGWREPYGNDYTYSITYVSKYNVVGNVKFLY